MSGQSYNPSAKDHHEVIQKVVAEELKEVKETQKRLRTLKPYLFKEENEDHKKTGQSLKEGLVK